MQLRMFASVLPLALLPGALGAAEKPLPPLEQRCVRGVYWPWERTQMNADAAGRELWAFADELMGNLSREYHCNAVWFVNGPPDRARICTLAAKHGMTAFVGTELAHFFVYGVPNDQALRDAAAKTVAEVGALPGCGAYVLKDEPRRNETALLEECRRALVAQDKTRPSVVVSMTHDTEAYADSTGFPILCSDIYHFGGPRSPNIPNPASTSQGSYRGAVNALVHLALTHSKVPWVMPQAFTDYWGPSWHDDKEQLVLEPGGYWHWRMPTVAEMHWQTWEGIRAGCRGVIYFSILLDGPDSWNSWRPAQGELPEKEKKVIADNAAAGRPQLTERVFTRDVSSLLLSGGRPTPQSRAMGEDFASLETLEGIIGAWCPAGFPMAFADAPFVTATFEVKANPGIRYAVVVNDDLQRPQTAAISLLPTVDKVTNLATRQPLTLRADPVGNESFLHTDLTLEPGHGCVLELQCRNNAPGLILYNETFAASLTTCVLENAERRNERAGFSMGWVWTVRKTGTPDTTALVKLPGLQKPPMQGNPFAGALNPAADKTAVVYLQADGVFPKAESLVVIGVDGNGKSTWLQSNSYGYPVRIPAGTTEVQLQLSADAALRGIRVWQVPVPAKPDAR